MLVFVNEKILLRNLKVTKLSVMLCNVQLKLLLTSAMGFFGTALESKVRLGEKKTDALLKDKMRVEAELESMTKKSHDASGQLVIISQELLKKER